MKRPVRVLLEVGSKRVFASAVDWPGWSRSGRGEGDALLALAAYGPRYATALAGSGLGFVAPGEADDLQVVERRAGNSGTDFGVPTLGPAGDELPVDDAELDRLVRILRAGWVTFDGAAARATAITLRTGRRGGGRSLAKIVAHVFESERAYLGQLGGRSGRPTPDTPVADAWARLRADILEALDARAQGRPLTYPSRVRTPWSTRSFVRRVVWHLLDHAWEIEDRADLAVP
ncbi:MAG: DinB family protein [Chloroflexota bacterium]